jgi:hypothetical protein
MLIDADPKFMPKKKADIGEIESALISPVAVLANMNEQYYFRLSIPDKSQSR